MTKKDFELIARILIAYNKPCYRRSEMHKEIVDVFCRYLSVSHPRFNENKFRNFINKQSTDSKTATLSKTSQSK